MNALKIVMAVHRIVLTQLDHTHAVAILGTTLLLMDNHVQVRHYHAAIAHYYTILLDINECTVGTASCTQICQNTVGSYTCNCRSGYRLDGNGYTCNGKSFTIQTCFADSADNF